MFRRSFWLGSALVLVGCLQGCKDQGANHAVAAASHAASAPAAAPSLAEDAALARFKREIVKSDHIPDDLLRLYHMQAQHASNEKEGADVDAMLGLKIIAPDELPSLLSNDYLSEQDLKNPDVRANVKAVEEVFAYCTFVATDDDSNLIGYWRGPENLPLDQAPIVQFDTEGQFALLDGKHLTEAVAAQVAFDDHKQFSELKAAFEKMGIVFSGDRYDALASPKGAFRESPSAMHQRLYEKYLAEETKK